MAIYYYISAKPLPPERDRATPSPHPNLLPIHPLLQLVEKVSSSTHASMIGVELRGVRPYLRQSASLSYASLSHSRDGAASW